MVGIYEAKVCSKKSYVTQWYVRNSYQENKQRMSRYRNTERSVDGVKSGQSMFFFICTRAVYHYIQFEGQPPFLVGIRSGEISKLVVSGRVVARLHNTHRRQCYSGTFVRSLIGQKLSGILCLFFSFFFFL